MINQYRVRDMVFAKCQGYPYWPGQVIATNPKENSCQVLFYGEKSSAFIEVTFIQPFNDETYKKFSEEPISKTNKTLKYSLELARKRYNKRKKGIISSSEENDFLQESETCKRN